MIRWYRTATDRVRSARELPLLHRIVIPAYAIGEVVLTSTEQA